MPILREELDALSKYGVLKTEMPEVITANLNPAFPLRDYQKEALFRFIFYITDYQERVKPTQLLFHMATGSGKTLIMAATILYLYQQGYRDFIFFVNSTNIIEKTRDNFLNPFTTIQGLHSSLNTPRENALTYEDFEDKRIVLISNEAHHINALTKSASECNKDEAENVNTWEATVNRTFRANAENLPAAAGSDFADRRRQPIPPQSGPGFFERSRPARYRRDALQRLAADLKSGTATYIGTREFRPEAVKACVRDKTMRQGASRPRTLKRGRPGQETSVLV